MVFHHPGACYEAFCQWPNDGRVVGRLTTPDFETEQYHGTVLRPGVGGSETLSIGLALL